MIILITGAGGQLGKDLIRKLSQMHSVYSFNKNELDITNKALVEQTINNISPDIIIHSAAYTSVDDSEINKNLAFEINSIGTGNVLNTARKSGARFIYISSDYVFDGKKTTPYSEEDNTNPQSVYGWSKLLGEMITLQYDNSTVIRTSWLYGHDGRNFVKTMLELGKQKREIRVVHDQIGSPTYTNDLAEFISVLSKSDKRGIFHYSNSGACSWYEFAKAIYKEAGYDADLVLPTTSQAYNALAPRPSYSVLGHNRLLKEKYPLPRHWHEALKEFIQKEKSI
ncbi:dTDP-4-dehydrorhamnose reductase [Bacillus tianshenii]|uniref:dTDP-4-dehydrorhamnose reductase n=1 Tax=Sutcliffiella tianshenii TaxID=1463404 RepID=A0ABS2P535_9BACI|nr:dTDP-4-dehydrorhamnose reductase [Bacillus tianshenii]MBM7622072.1 dTDP-4-dehydrorhamnose reductase [Bacillus tianshenii]